MFGFSVFAGLSGNCSGCHRLIVHVLMVMVCLYIRPAECDRPPLPQHHAQCSTEHLSASESLPAKPAVGQDAAVTSSEKAVIRQDTAASCDVESVTKSALRVDGLVSTECKEPVTLPELHSARQMRDSELELQQKKDALRLVFRLLCATLVVEIFAVVC